LLVFEGVSKRDILKPPLNIEKPEVFPKLSFGKTSPLSKILKETCQGQVANTPGKNICFSPGT
jgi:hypothetical protein